MKKSCQFSLTELYERVGIPDSGGGEVLRAMGTVVSFSKGEDIPLTHKGEPFLYLLMSGCVCCELETPDGRSILECISYLPGSCINPVGMFTGSTEPTRCFCLLDTRLALFPMYAVQKLISEDMSLMRLYSEALAAALGEQAKHKYMLSLRAEERYAWFLKYYEAIAELIPVRIVAQFLNIDPATLSRIRKKAREA